MKCAPYFALDNGAFSAYTKGAPFDEHCFLKTLSNCLKYEIPLDFIVCPDLVGGGKDSLEFSLWWSSRLNAPKLLALVVNDEIDFGDITPKVLKNFSFLFVSGGFSKKWKKWVDFGHKHKKKVHIGKVGNVCEINYAEKIGADSIDSTNFVRNNDFSAFVPVSNKTQMLFF